MASGDSEEMKAGATENESRISLENEANKRSEKPE